MSIICNLEDASVDLTYKFKKKLIEASLDLRASQTENW